MHEASPVVRGRALVTYCLDFVPAIVGNYRRFTMSMNYVPILDDENCTVTSRFSDLVSRYPDCPLFTFVDARCDPTVKWNLSQTLTTVQNLGRWMLSSGIKLRELLPTDRVLLLCNPGADFVKTFLGCLYSGVVAVPCYPPMTERQSYRLIQPPIRAPVSNTLCGGRLAPPSPPCQPLLPLRPRDLPVAVPVHSFEPLCRALSSAPNTAPDYVPSSSCRSQTRLSTGRTRTLFTAPLMMEEAFPSFEEAIASRRKMKWLSLGQFEAEMQDGPAWTQLALPEVHNHSLALLQYTSGSTGTPKGVRVSHRNLLAQSVMQFSLVGHDRTCNQPAANRIDEAFEYWRFAPQPSPDNPDAWTVSWLPPYHDMGLIGGIIIPVVAAVHCVMINPLGTILGFRLPPHFLGDPMIWPKAVSRYRATISGGPNFAYELVLKAATDEKVKSLDLSTWLLAFNGAEPVRESTLNRFAARFAPANWQASSWYGCYGLAEAHFFCTLRAS
eukprot:gene1754-2906_t